MKTESMTIEVKKLRKRAEADAQFVNEFLDGGKYLPHFIAAELFANRHEYYEGEEDFISLVDCYEIVNAELATDAKYTDLH